MHMALRLIDSSSLVFILSDQRICSSVFKDFETQTSGFTVLFGEQRTLTQKHKRTALLERIEDSAWITSNLLVAESNRHR